ncbi:MAG: hypothetical protein GX496_01075, partial [Firmicutes bacterium]|nr:hypothetical protein [Bacillota bacterium]
FPTLDEGRRLTGLDEPPSIAARLRSLGVKMVVLKLGPAGCYVDGPGGAFLSPGFRVEAVDTTGAGDCFAAAFLAAYLEGGGLREAARFANAAGALSTLVVGGAEAAPTRQDVLEFLARNNQAMAGA